MFKGPEIDVLLKKYLHPMIEAGVDHIVLGCSHYPYLIPAIKSHLPKHIELIDSGYAVARQTMAILEKNGILSNAEPTDSNGYKIFWTNGDPNPLNQLIKIRSALGSKPGIIPTILEKEF